MFPAYLNCLYKKGVHVLTFNDYLAKRDALWMKPIYDLLGVTVAFVQETMNNQEKKEAYSKDITYVTAKEAGFDYLRDSLTYDKKDLIHRNFYLAIVDEADSILIDEARVPLVIASKTKEVSSNLQRVRDVISTLIPKVDYQIDDYSQNVYLTEQGIKRIEKFLQCDNLYTEKNFKLVQEVNCALYAEALLQRDVDYIVRNKRIEMVDEFTGRVAENRHWPDGVQAALECKEGLEIQSKGRIMTQISLQHFIKQYENLAGMTGTAVDSAEQLKGRAGRQGDPGITRFFISLEDDLIAKYGIENMIPKSFYPRKQEESLTNPIFAKKICQAQRIIQGQNYDLREELYSYSTLLTELRQYLYNLRMDILHHKFKDEVLQKDFPSLYEDLSGKDPLREFQMKLVEEFKLLQEEIEESIKEDYRKVELSAEAFEEIKEKIKGQETTWTYLVNDDSIEDILGLLKGLVKITGMNNFFAWVTFALEYGFYKFFGKNQE